MEEEAAVGEVAEAAAEAAALEVDMAGVVSVDMVAQEVVVVLEEVMAEVDSVVTTQALNLAVGDCQEGTVEVD